jgi:phosphoribosylformylglycinamidine synthase I
VIKPRAIILRAAGTNCDIETRFALELAGAFAERVHINRLFAGEVDLDEYQITVIPGGFTYGDDIGAGRILANQLRYRLGESLAHFIDQGRLLLGICNGMQVLVKAGLLPRLEGKLRQEITLTFNDSGKFEDRWVHLQPDPAAVCVFTRGMDRLITLPVAHAEGKVVPSSDQMLSRMEEAGLVAVRYVTPEGDLPSYPDNPNGSVGNVAGLCDVTGRVFGLMPHPERYVHPTQHPRWTHRGLDHEPDGIAFFRNAVAYFE